MRIFTAAFYQYRQYRLTVVIVGFYCHVISCALERRGVRRGAAKASDSGGVQRVWVW